MTAELPTLVLDRSSNWNLRQRSESRQNAKSALESHRSIHDPDSGIPENVYKKSKRNSEGQVLQVKFAANVTDLVNERMKTDVNERMKTDVASLNPTYKVDHKHYEQWARVPGKKVAKTSLLRGIQQLKAKMNREERNGLSFKPDENVRELRVFKSPNRELHINQLKRNTLLTRDKLTDECGIRFRREKTSLGIESVSALKNVTPTRNQLKTNSHLIDSGVFKQEERNASVACETDARISRNNERDSAKLRHGVSRIRDRSSLPISVYQPVNVGDHVFLVNEPVKDNDFLKLNKIGTRDPQGASMLLLTDKSEENNFLKKAPEVTFEMIFGKTDPIADGIQRTRAMTGGYALPSRAQRRTQFTVSSAELYDFSQLSEIRHSMAEKLLERSQTELLFPSRTLRDGYKICNG